MAITPRILVFGGSLRRDSYNHKLAALAAEGARDAGAEVTVIALRDFPLPVFDQEIEDSTGMPEPGARLKELFVNHHGLLISSPEYNSSISCSLKTAFDWVSRETRENEPTLEAFTGKTAALCSASPGGLGGLRGLVHVRAILGNLGVVVLPDQVAIPKADQAFSDDGKLRDKNQAASIHKLGETLAQYLFKILA